MENNFLSDAEAPGIDIVGNNILFIPWLRL